MFSSGAAAAAGAIIQATRASGVIVSVAPDDFLGIVHANDEPLVVHAKGWFLGTKHHYLTSYRGLAFFTKHSELLPLPEDCFVVEAKRIWIPGSM